MYVHREKEGQANFQNRWTLTDRPVKQHSSIIMESTCTLLFHNDNYQSTEYTLLHTLCVQLSFYPTNHYRIMSARFESLLRAQRVDVDPGV